MHTLAAAALVLAAAPALAPQPQALAFVAGDDLTRYLADGGGDRAALVARLRARGQAGLDDVLRAVPLDQDGLPALRTLRAQRAFALADDVAGQKNAAYTGVYWHTSLADALAEAKRTHKPVLSLRLLGRLDDELSCANSRYFRSLVYPDAKVRALLRDRFVLHWQSVRPAPKVTIDMGDGRTLVTTVTGNSAHIVLDEDGTVVDAIAGLYSAPAFAAALEDALALNRTDDRVGAHQARVARIEASWKKLAASLGVRAQLPALVDDGNGALAVSPIAITKALPERAVLQKITPRALPPDLSPIFQRVGAQQGALLQLSPGARAIFRSQLAPGVDEERALQKTLAAVAADSAQNEIVLHRQLHQWIAGGIDGAALQTRMYTELFKTPDADPWLGLVETDSYAGVAGGGVVR